MNATSHDMQALLARIAELEQHAVDCVRQIEEAANELDAFGSALSHDLRAPLRAIEGFSRLLLEQPHIDQLDPTGKDYLHRIHGASLKLGQMIEALLQLVRLTRGGIRPVRIDLSATAQDIVQRLKAGDAERRVDVAIEPGIAVTGDIQLLRMALEHLLSNAWKFTANKDIAEISVGITHDDGVAAVYVRDNGAGFDQEYADKLFRPFQRLHSDSEFPGIGIGLAKVQRVMLAHGGRVWARGQRGSGASFYITLPGIEAATRNPGHR